MTQEQAIDLREHLIKQLNENGFSDIVTEVNTRLEESYEENDFQRSPRALLTFFLSQSIDVLESLSNKNYADLINRFSAISGETIKTISVELLNQGKSATYDLKDLPQYENITEVFKNVLTEINNEN